MAHPTPYLPEGVLEKLGEITIAGKTLVTKDATLTPLGVGAYWALAGFLLFTLAYKLSKYYTPLYFKGYKTMKPLEQRDWDTRLGNIAYSAYIVYWAVRLLVLDDYFWRAGGGPITKRVSTDSYAALGVSLGFFAMELLPTLKYWMGGSAMVLHHIGSLTCVAVAAAAGDGHALTLWMLSTEFTTPFIAARYMLDKAGLKSHPIYVVNGLLIVASWTVARMATFLPFFKTAWDVRAQVPLMNPLSQVLLLVFPATLAVLNTWWYYKIVKGALKVLGPKKKPVGKTQ
ncbi:hypothetical protein CHLRE_08g358531v5 [Chlamydomonas reinhardtii]|uniref:TLC domain-containing protein n=1 Tax=Chlamydomonas reinhardtii TaxID=3055 RepID=A0A2K3DG53_CHLRE|nr:uncharacterized protein CHLRE_08g358531v5 [Chlamydomonas reinhardtii]PNW79524.1 hypothetical protein CHLRE_08g358531v5 [Chlamydomonas reinhardtii]